MYTGITGALKRMDALGRFITIGYISDWSITDKTEMIEASSLTEINKKAFAGAQSWSASANGTVCFDRAGGHDELFSAQYNGDKILFHFYLNDGEKNDSGKNTYLCGEGYIESLGLNLTAEDRGTVTIGVVGTGALELIVDDVNAVSKEKHMTDEALRLKIEDGHLYAVVPDGMGQSVWVDDTGYLVVKL